MQHIGKHPRTIFKQLANLGNKPDVWQLCQSLRKHGEPKPKNRSRGGEFHSTFEKMALEEGKGERSEIAGGDLVQVGTRKRIASVWKNGMGHCWGRREEIHIYDYYMTR